MNERKAFFDLVSFGQGPESREIVGERLLAWAVVAQWMRDVMTVMSGGKVYDEETVKPKRARPGRPPRRLLTLEDLRAWLETDICRFWVEGVLGIDVDFLRDWFDDLVTSWAQTDSPVAKSSWPLPEEESFKQRAAA